MQLFRSNLAALFGLDKSHKADGASTKSGLTYTPLKQPKKQAATAKGVPSASLYVLNITLYIVLAGSGDSPALLAAATVESQKQ